MIGNIVEEAAKDELTPTLSIFWSAACSIKADRSFKSSTLLGRLWDNLSWKSRHTTRVSSTLRCCSVQPDLF